MFRFDFFDKCERVFYLFLAIYKFVSLIQTKKHRWCYSFLLYETSTVLITYFQMVLKGIFTKGPSLFCTAEIVRPVSIDFLQT